MAAEIFRHAEMEEVADDVDHPIPALDVLDVSTVKRDGGADLCIVIAKPIQDDANSQNRLLKKIEAYLGFIGSAQFRDECGLPNPANTQVIVHIHPDSSLAIFELLERSKPWVSANHAALVVTLLDQSVQ